MDEAATPGGVAPSVDELVPPDRLLMGPGPSEVHSRVLRAQATPIVGHLDPSFIETMDEVQSLLRYVFRTDNQWTIPVSGTGSAAMEAAFANLVRPGDTVLVPDNGYFGERMGAMAERAGGSVESIPGEWGEPVQPEALEAAIETHDPDVVGLVHAETSTGVLQQDVAAIADRVHDAGAMLVLDAVASLGGVELRVDEWGVDVAYSGAQKCLSCPPGASPLTLSDEAMEHIHDRDAPVRCWYLDLSLLEGYWGEDRAYHHTAPITNVWALREALRLVAEEGIEARWDRHSEVASLLRDGLERRGFDLVPDDAHWLPSLNAVRTPDGVDADALGTRLLETHGIEVGGGLGKFAGDALRIGCMGHTARRHNVAALLDAIDESLDALA